ncbi:hypothetical protein KRP22_005464 [Phytophthora ramorum]|nr:hypothetical protein KRP22_3404 [Phytophthora ramorum]
MDLSMILSPALKPEAPAPRPSAPNDVQDATIQPLKQEQHTADDAMSRLDLLVQADAIMKQCRPTSPTSQYVRSGVWPRAEEQYAAALVSFFLEGQLHVPEGTTLRKFLAEKLCCNRRRVSMKLGTETLAGRKIPKKAGATVFVAADPPPTEEQRREIEQELEALRQASFSSGLLDRQEDDGGYAQRRLSNEEDGGIALRPRRKTAAYGRTRSTRHEYRPKRGKPTIIRTGFESPEEEEFVTTMIEFFTSGSLSLPQGTKLVTYLCQQLGCTLKQLSMKLAPQHMGEHKFPDDIGSMTYQRQGDSLDSSDDDDFSEELFEVESRLTELRVAYEEAHKNTPLPVVAPVTRKRKISSASMSSIETASVTSTASSPVRPYQHSGPWSHDEEVFMAALIDCFFKGVLDVAVGTTLRAFLSTRLCCNPMRISKKLSSESIAEIRIPKKLGSSTYVRRTELTPQEEAAAEDSLQSLRAAHLLSSSKRGKWGSKRQRASRSGGFRSHPQIAAVDTDSDCDTQSVVPSYAGGASLEKLQKTAKANSPAQEAQRQRFQAHHNSPKLHVLMPASFKQQSA